jgi:hypothetical protein
VIQMAALAVVLGVTICGAIAGGGGGAAERDGSGRAVEPTVLGVVVLSDLLVILMFALALAFARPLLGALRRRA